MIRLGTAALAVAVLALGAGFPALAMLGSLVTLAVAVGAVEPALGRCAALLVLLGAGYAFAVHTMHPRELKSRISSVTPRPCSPASGSEERRAEDR